MVKIGNLLIIGGIGLLLFSLIGGGDSLGDIFNKNQKKVICDVRVSNLVGFGAIEDVSCQSSEKGCGLFSSSPLAITSTKFLVELQIGDEKTSKTIDVSIFAGIDKTATLELCVDKALNSGQVRLLKEGNLVGSKGTNF